MSQDISPGIIKLGIAAYRFGSKIAPLRNALISQVNRNPPPLATDAPQQIGNGNKAQIEVDKEDTGEPQT
jgi:hypothetical protein